MSLRGHIAAILAAGCVSFVGAPGSARAEDGPQAAGDKWGAWTEFGGYGANRSDARRGEATLWAPLVQDGRSLVFADLRGRFFDEGENEGNFALGYRRVGEYGWNPGFWVGLDRRHTEFDSDFNQVSFGLEALSPDWDLRVNAYVPLNQSELAASTTSVTGPSLEVIGGTILLVPGVTTLTDLYEIAFWGVDAEVGFRIPLERLGMGTFHAVGLKGEEAGHSRRRHDLRVFLGGYYFDHPDFDEEIAGPRLRAEWRIENILEDWDSSRLTFEAAYQHDDVRDNQLEAGLRLRIPLGGRASTPHDALSPQEMRMTEGLKRDRDIVTHRRLAATTTGGGAPEAVEDAVTGVDFDSISFVGNGSDFNAALAGAGSNALLVAFGGASNFGPSIMAPNQTLLGGGGLIQVRSRVSGTVLTYAAPGTRPTFEPPGFGSFVITAADNAHINNVNIQGVLSGGIEVGPGQRVVVDNVSTTTAIGLLAMGAGSNITLRNSTISGAILGVQLIGQNNTLLMENNVFRDVLADGILISESSGGLTRNTITAIGNTFAGSFGGYLFSFVDGISDLAAGSTGNVDVTTGSSGQCVRNLGTTLNGSIDFVGGATVEQSTCVIP